MCEMIYQYSFKVNEYSFRGERGVTLMFDFASLFQFRSTFKVLLKRKFFSLRVGLVWKGLCFMGKQTGSHKSCSPVIKQHEKMEAYPSLERGDF